jgi:hypothetical protein
MVKTALMRECSFFGTRKEWSGYIKSLSFLFVIVGMLGVKKRMNTDSYRER